MIGIWSADNTWKNNIKYHLPKIAKEKIEELEKDKKALQDQNRRYREKLNERNNIIRRIRTLTGG